MCRTPAGLRVGAYLLPQHPTLSNMTRSELNFALLVEEMLNHISQPEYRQIIVEVNVFKNDFKIRLNFLTSFFFQLLNIVSTILVRNPELTFQSQLDLDHLVSEAISMFSKVTKI